MPIAQKPQRNYVPQYPLRTLVWFTLLGPPLLALAWWSLIPVWRHIGGSPHNLGVTLVYPGTLLVLFLMGFSILYYPVALSPRIRLHRSEVILLWVIESATLWHWLTFMSVLWGWMLVWGDRHEPPMEVIYPATALIAATISSMTSMRLVKDGATFGYLSVVVSLTAILILFGMPFWFARLFR